MYLRVCGYVPPAVCVPRMPDARTLASSCAPGPRAPPPVPEPSAQPQKAATAMLARWHLNRAADQSPPSLLPFHSFPLSSPSRRSDSKKSLLFRGGTGAGSSPGLPLHTTHISPLPFTLVASFCFQLRPPFPSVHPPIPYIAPHPVRTDPPSPPIANAAWPVDSGSPRRTGAVAYAPSRYSPLPQEPRAITALPPRPPPSSRLPVLCPSLRSL